MARGRPLPSLTLSDEERRTLQGWTRRRTTAQALAQRARVVLECATGKPNRTVARELRLDEDTIGKWRQRFVDRRLDGLLDEPRAGAPRTITDEQVEDIVTLTLESTPRDATHWSTRAMAARSGLSQSSVGRIWRAFGLQPHRAETFKLSKDPLFVDKVRDIVGFVPESPRPCPRALRRREVADLGARSHAAVAAHATGPSGAPHPRLGAARDHLAVCRARREDRGGDRPVSSPPPHDRVSQVPRRD
jgi:transposase